MIRACIGCSGETETDDGVCPECSALADRVHGKRIADLEAQIAAIKAELASVGLMLAYHDPGVPTVAIRPGQYHLLKKTFEL